LPAAVRRISRAQMSRFSAALAVSMQLMIIAHIGLYLRAGAYWR